MNLDRGKLDAFALALAPAAAAVANYCDHVEHNEPADPGWVAAAADRTCALALEFAASIDADIFALYAQRLAFIEERNVLKRPDSYNGQAAASAATNWRQLQIVQSEHDRFYHSDVVGLAKSEQLRHYALHLAKIVGAFAQPANTAELVSRRLPDTLLFAIKLHTVIGRRLPNEALPRSPSARRRAPPVAGAAV